MVATSIMATLMASVVVTVRSAQSAWQAHRDDAERAESAYALLRHIVRNVRQAESINSISGPTDNAGAITLSMPSAATLAYAKTGTNVMYQSSLYTTDSLLADNIDGLTFVGYEADAATATTAVENIQALECIVTFTESSGASRTLRSFTWVRAW